MRSFAVGLVALAIAVSGFTPFAHVPAASAQNRETPYGGSAYPGCMQPMLEHNLPPGSFSVIIVTPTCERAYAKVHVHQRDYDWEGWSNDWGYMEKIDGQPTDTVMTVELDPSEMDRRVPGSPYKWDLYMDRGNLIYFVMKDVQGPNQK